MNSQQRAWRLTKETVKATFSPPSTMTISQWADAERVVSASISALPGRWKTSTVEYARGIQDAISDPDTYSVAIMAAAQVAKTEILLNAIGKMIHLDPGPMLFIVPTASKAREFSTERLAPMLRESPALRGLIDLSRTRSSSNTILEKSFAGGHLSMVGANVPGNLASRPIKYLFADEVDRLAESAGAEGDPLDLAIVRTKTFTHRGRKIVMASSPTIAGMSRIEAAFMESDQRYFFVPCPDCGHFQILSWSNVQFQNHDPETARYQCSKCESFWDDVARNKAVSQGEWRATQPFDGKAGFHLSEIYSPFSSLKDIVSAFLVAKDSRSIERMRVWTNTCLGQVWEDDGTEVSEHELAKRTENYPAEVPMPVVILTAGVDVQEDRLESEVVGWNQDEESWGIAKYVLMGDPGHPAVWQELDKVLFRTYTHESGTKMRVQSIAVDSGYMTQAVYTYCKARRKNGVHAIKGRGGFGIPFVGNPTRNNRVNLALFMIGVDPGKESITNKLALDTPGPGYCHFPKGVAGYNDEHFKQLAAERLVTRYSKGVRRREWKKLRERNEALDCRVYAYAALYILNPDLAAIAANFVRVAAKVQEVGAEPEDAPTPTVDPAPEFNTKRAPIFRKPTRPGQSSIRDRIRGGW